MFNGLSNARYILSLKCNYWSKGAGTAGTTHRTEHGLTDIRTRTWFPEEARGFTLLCAFRKMSHYIPDCPLAPYTGWFRMKGQYFWRWYYRSLWKKRLMNVLTYLLTPWCRVLLEKLTSLQLVKKFPAFHGTRRFITALTSVRHLSLSWASPFQSIYPHPTSWRAIQMLSIHLRVGLPSGLLPSGFSTKTLYTPSPHPYVPHAQPISFFSILSPAQYWVRSTNHLAPYYAISSIPPLPRPS